MTRLARRPPHLDPDLAAYVKQLSRVPAGVFVRAIVLVALLLGIDTHYQGKPTIIGWLAVIIVASVALSLRRIAKVLAHGASVWALAEQERRSLPPPEVPPSPNRPTTRPRNAIRRQPGEGRSQARLTPIPDDPPREAQR